MIRQALAHLDAVGRGDDPPVGDERRPALVLELAGLVLPQRHLPRPLRVAGHVPAHDSRRSEELPSADLTVVRVRVESVEGSSSAFRTDGVVVKRNVDLGFVFANVISGIQEQSTQSEPIQLFVFIHLSCSQSASLNLTMFWSNCTQFSSVSELPGSPGLQRSRVSSAPS